MTRIDLKALATRESEQTEWKENVADVDDVVATLSAFANDLANLGGGYVVCGARETRDEHDFPKLEKPGLSAGQLKKIENQVMAKCRDQVQPAITPLVDELEADAPDRRVLVFTQAATAHAHTFNHHKKGSHHFIRRARSTERARNGLLRDLYVRKGDVEAWDVKPCPGATISDLDLLALRVALTEMDLFDPDQGVDPYLSDTRRIHALIPPLLAKDGLSGKLQPRNFAVVLFGNDPQRFVLGAHTVFSIYRGIDKSESPSQRHELVGSLFEQVRKARALLSAEVMTVHVKTDLKNPNRITYPERALHEALSNALAHRDYESRQPTRITVFADRVEFHSPGGLMREVKREDFESGKAGPVWRNAALTQFFIRLQIAQAEGQGVRTIFRTMREAKCPPPEFRAEDGFVECVLRARVNGELQDGEAFVPPVEEQ